MARKPKGEVPEDEELEEDLSDEEDELDEAGFHVSDGEDEDEGDAPASAKDDEKGLDSEEDVEYVRGPKKARRRSGTKLLDDYEDHLAAEEKEDGEEDSEEDDLDDEEDWDDEEESDDEEDEEDDEEE